MSQRILVTGGSGYLGTHIRRYFNADDFSRRSGHDLTDPQAAQRLADYDVIIHLAGVVDKRPEAEDRCFELNTTGTANLLQYLRPGQAFIFASTKDVYGPHANNRELVDEGCPTSYAGQHAYDWSKLLAEKYVEYHTARRGVRSGIFRLATTYAPPSPGNTGSFVNFFVKATQSGQRIVLKARGQQRRDFLHVDDLARAFERFLASDLPAEIFNIGGGKTNSTTLKGLTEIIGELTDREPVVELSDEPEVNQMHYCTDTSKLERLLGWRPELSLRAGLRTIL